MNPASLTTGSLPGHIRSIALPVSIGLFFNTMYDTTNNIFTNPKKKQTEDYVTGRFG